VKRLAFLLALAGVAACIDITGVQVTRSYVVVCVVSGDTLYLSQPDSALRCAVVDTVRTR